MRTQPPYQSHSGEHGFSLVEAIVAMSILVIGLLGLAQVFYIGMHQMATSSANLIAREKAREAIESVHAARDTRVITWAEIRNVNAPDDCPAGTTGAGGGVFLNGEREMRKSGPDGLVNTADDFQETDPHRYMEYSPGPDNRFGTDDDVPLSGQFWRQIQICDVNDNTSLREIVVTIQYRVGDQTRTYRLMSYISSYA